MEAQSPIKTHWKLASVNEADIIRLHKIINGLQNDTAKLTALQKTKHLPIILAKDGTQDNVAFSPGTYEILSYIDVELYKISVRDGVMPDLDKYYMLFGDPLSFEELISVSLQTR